MPFASTEAGDIVLRPPPNFAIDRSDIKKAKFKTGYGDTADDYLLIKTAKETHRLLGLQSGHKKRFTAAGFTRWCRRSRLTGPDPL